MEAVAPPMTQPPELLRPPPAGRTRRLVNVFILGFLVFQLATPLTYYLKERTPDERFSWRMFSPVILQICTVTAFETHRQGDRPVLTRVNLAPDLHRAWINLLQRYNPDLVRAVLRWRCEQSGAVSTHLMRQCQSPGGRPLPVDRITCDCATGTFRVATD